MTQAIYRGDKNPLLLPGGTVHIVLKVRPTAKPTSTDFEAHVQWPSVHESSTSLEDFFLQSLFPMFDELTGGKYPGANLSNVFLEGSCASVASASSGEGASSGTSGVSSVFEQRADVLEENSVFLLPLLRDNTPVGGSAPRPRGGPRQADEQVVVCRQCCYSAQFAKKCREEKELGRAGEQPSARYDPWLDSDFSSASELRRAYEQQEKLRIVQVERNGRPTRSDMRVWGDEQWQSYFRSLKEVE